MNRVFQCFLFRRRPAPELSRSGRAAFWLWNWVGLMLAALALGLACLVLAPAQYGWVLFWDYLTKPALVALNLLPPVVLAALFYGVTGRTWAAYLIAALPCLGLSIGNYYKLAFRDDPVVASDLLILGEAGKMAGQYQLFVFTKLLAALAVAAVSLLLLILFFRGRLKGWNRPVTALAALAVSAALCPAYTSGTLYSQTACLEHLNQWSSTQQYISHGFLYPFLHSVKDAFPDPPEGYSQREVDALLSQYQDADIPEDKKVNVVGVMLEAFSDFSQFEQIEFQQDVYQVYHQLEAESYTGSLVTNIFAGGTVNTERAFLTGVSSGDFNYRGNADSYVRYLKSQGYQTSGDHPCNNWFYNRRNVNAYLGFDQYRYVENYYTQFTGGDTAPDWLFFPELTRSIQEQLAADAPLFSFSVSYQGHGPYSGEQCWWGAVDDFIGNYDLDQQSRTILANYLGSVQDTQKHLAEMVDVFRDSDEPIVLVVFGDHKPWLGNSGSVYSALGIDLSGADQDSFYRYWSTRYLIWANDAAKAALGDNFVGEGPDVSPCFLMDVLFERCGWQGDAYMQAVRACRQTVPVLHTTGRYVLADGTYTDQLTQEQQALVQQFRCLEYDREQHFHSLA